MKKRDRNIAGNGKRETRGKRTLWILLAAAAVIAAAGIWNRELIRIIRFNVISETVSMDDSQVWEGGSSYERLQYAEVSDSDYMNLYVPDAQEPMPLLILVHGGGFISNDCEARQAQFMYRYFRDHGYACASVNYRLSTEAAYPAALEDVKAAVRFLRANAEEYGYDPERFVIWGESAGGYLASMAAVTADDEFNGVKFIGEEALSEPVSGSVLGLMDYYGIIDFELAEADYEELGIPEWLLKLSALPLGRDLQGYDTVEDLWIRKAVGECSQEELAEMNARYYIEKNRQQTAGMKVLICHGDADLSVPVIQSKRLYDAFAAGQYEPEPQTEDYLEGAGAEGIVYRVFPDYKHADDRFYSDEALAETELFLQSVFEEK